MRPAADDDFVRYQNTPHGQVLALPGRRLLRPAADDDFVVSIFSLVIKQLFQGILFK